MEIHVPPRFTADRPAVGFSRLTFETPIREHPVGSKMPEATQSFSVQAPSEMDGLCASTSAQKDLQTYINEELPQLHLHVTNFTDNTIVFITWSHISFDAQGLLDLLQNWSHVMAGREDKVQTFLGAESDILEEFAPATTEPEEEPFGQQPLLLHGFNKFAFFCRGLWRGFRAGRPVKRLICLPPQVIQRLKQEARQDALKDKEDVFEGDILTAWASKIVAECHPKSRPLSIWSAVNCKFRLPSLNHNDGVYPQNLAVPLVFTNITREEASESIGSIARITRKSLMKQATEDRTLSYLRLRRQTFESGTTYSPLFTEADSLPILLNNLAKLSMLKAIDFGPAVVKTPGQTKGKGAGKPVYHHYYTAADSTARLLRLPRVVILGKDGQGNCWMSVSASARFWDRMEHQVKRFGPQTKS